MLRKLLAQLVVLLLAMRLLGQFAVTLLDDLLQIAPGVLERLHREPGVRIGSDVEALDLLVERGQCLEVGLGRGERRLELGVCFAQRSDLFDGVATHRIGQILFGVFEPGVEGGRLLGEGQVELFDLPELVLHGEQAVLAGVGGTAEGLPARDDILVALENGRGLGVLGADQMILEAGDVVNALLFECAET